VQQLQQPKTASAAFSASPLLSSPNTLRLLQDMQNTRISSPQPPRNNTEFQASDFDFLGDFKPTGPTVKEESWQPDSLVQIPQSWLAEPNTSWTDETWNDLAGTSSWTEESKSSDGEDDSPPSDLADYWLDPGAVNTNTTASGLGLSYEHDLSEVAETLNSTHQILNELPEVPMANPISLLLKILITRDTLERWTYDEFFNKSLRGFYVRVRIAEVNGIFLHRLGCIVEARDNCFEPGLSGPHDLGKGLVVHFGSSGQHMISIAAVSNTPPNERECEDWVTDAQKNNISIMPQEVQEKLATAAYLDSKQHNVYSSH